MKRRLQINYIVPSRYDEDGYVCRFWRGVVPSNTLQVLKALTESLGASGALGDDVELSVRIYDDCVQRPPLKRIMRTHKRGRTTVVAGFVGVQSNQFPRAADLAMELREAGVPVMIGGFHVSGTLAVFDQPPAELQRLLDAGVALVKGEAEAPGALEGLLADALDGQLQGVYDIAEPPDLTNAPAPLADMRYVNRFLSSNATLDTSRGCPFGCTFCTIINVQGRRMRCRSAASVLRSVRANYDAGVKAYFFTDDNLSRSPVWEQLFDGMRVMREHGTEIAFMMQVDTQAWKIPNFVRKARDAGCRMVFVGMESVNPRNMEAAGKTQNDASEYAEMVRTWRRAGIIVHVGYIIGLPHDTPESVRRDIETLRDVVQVDEATFFMLTPLPGSEDHKQMIEEGVPVDADLNNFDSAHETFRHANFAPGHWRETYDGAYEAMYNTENITNALLRTPPEKYWHMFVIYLWYRFSGVYARTHPMATGLFRLKDRLSRRPVFPRESVLQYLRRRAKDLSWGLRVYGALMVEFQEIWMLTRKPSDPRWATLAELRLQWARARDQLRELDLSGRYDAAQHEVTGLLQQAQERFQQLAHTSSGVSRRTRRRALIKAREVRRYLRSLELQPPSPAAIASARDYVAQSVVAGYEEMAIRYVAKRRQLNAARREAWRRLRSGEFTSREVLRAPRLLLAEALLAVRFGFTMLTQSG